MSWRGFRTLFVTSIRFRERRRVLIISGVKLISVIQRLNTRFRHTYDRKQPSYDQSRWVNWTLTRMCSHEYTRRVLVPGNRYERAADPSFNFHSNIWVQTKMISCHFCPTNDTTDQRKNFVTDLTHFYVIYDRYILYNYFYVIRKPLENWNLLTNIYKKKKKKRKRNTSIDLTLLPISRVGIFMKIHNLADNRKAIRLE